MVKNPQKHIVERIEAALKRNSGYCPCVPYINEDTKCPCKKFREQEECCCNLYVKSDS